MRLSLESDFLVVIYSTAGGGAAAAAALPLPLNGDRKEKMGLFHKVEL